MGQRAGHRREVYFDLSKAFDKVVPHKRLVATLEALLSALTSTCAMDCGVPAKQSPASLGKWVEVPRGVPQGSVLGPVSRILA